MDISLVGHNSQSYFSTHPLYPNKNKNKFTSWGEKKGNQQTNRHLKQRIKVIPSVPRHMISRISKDGALRKPRHF